MVYVLFPFCAWICGSYFIFLCSCALSVLALGVICQFVCFWRNSPQWATASLFTGLLDHTQRSTTHGKTPLDEWSARRRDLYLTTHNNHNRQKSMPPVRFEPTISAWERPKNYAWDRDAFGMIWQYISNKEQRLNWSKFYWNSYAKTEHVRSNQILVDNYRGFHNVLRDYKNLL